MLLTAAGGGAARTLVFLPGFMGSAESYRELLTPVAEGGTTVIVPQLYRRGVAALLGRVSVAAEAEAAAELVRATALERPESAVFLGGHSRGGQAAWRAAGLLAPGLPAGLVLLDPVDGEGRDTTTPTGEMMANITAVVAQWERRIISQRTSDALQAMNARGVRLGGPVTLPAEIRARIASERADGRTLRAIAAGLVADGIPTARGGAWHAGTVRAVCASVALDALAMPG